MDTATQTASIALYDWQAQNPEDAGADTARLQAEWTWAARRRQTQDLTATVQTLLAHMNLTPADLTAVAVTTGPGSFTGVRIAASTAKGIELGLPHPIAAIGLPVLSVTAAPWLAPAQSAGAQVWAYLQAGRGRFNWCIFDRHLTNGNLNLAGTLWRPGVTDHYTGRLEDLVTALAACPAPVWLVGEETGPLRASVTSASGVSAGATGSDPGLDHVTVIDAVSGARRAGNLARLAGLHLAHGHRDELAELQPLYLNQP